MCQSLDLSHKIAGMKAATAATLILLATLVIPAELRRSNESVSASDSPCASNWVADALPILDTPTGLESVAVIAKDNVWAVGGRSDGLGSSTLIEHWDGVAWSVVESPNPSPYFNALKDVSGSSRNDVWAVGWQASTQDSPVQPLILHWDGTSWSERAYSIAGGRGTLRGVLALSPTDVWAVGGYSDGSQQRSLILHWDGITWGIVQSPSNSEALNELSAIDGSADRQLWAVGSPNLPGLTPADDLLQRRDGTEWIETEGISGLIHPHLEDVGVFSDESAWAVGEENLSAFVQRWGRSEWVRATEGFPNVEAARLVSIAVLRDDEVWIAGITVETNTLAPLIAHWNGQTWASSMIEPSGYLLGIDFDWRGNLWVVGTRDNSAYIAHSCTMPSTQPQWGNFDCADGLGSSDLLAVLRLAAAVSPRANRRCPVMDEGIDVDNLARQWGRRQLQWTHRRLRSHPSAIRDRRYCILIANGLPRGWRFGGSVVVRLDP